MWQYFCNGYKMIISCDFSLQGNLKISLVTAQDRINLFQIVTQTIIVYLNILRIICYLDIFHAVSNGIVMKTVAFWKDMTLEISGAMTVCKECARTTEWNCNV